MRVVFDIHLYVNNMLGGDSSWPQIVELPPSTGNPSADCISLVFDSDDIELYSSPHIIRNLVRILKNAGQSAGFINQYVADLGEIIEESGGAIIEPPALDRGVRDHEDNYILDLVKAADADILVTDDTDLTPLSPWNGRPILRPHEFVARELMRKRRGR